MGQSKQVGEEPMIAPRKILNDEDMLWALYQLNDKPANKIKEIIFDAALMWWHLADGRRVGIPLEQFPWLRDATPQQRANYKIGELDIFWDELDDGVDIIGSLFGSYATSQR